jgi:hypothetical protein
VLIHCTLLSTDQHLLKTQNKLLITSELAETLTVVEWCIGHIIKVSVTRFRSQMLISQVIASKSWIFFVQPLSVYFCVSQQLSQALTVKVGVTVRDKVGVRVREERCQSVCFYLHFQVKYL